MVTADGVVTTHHLLNPLDPKGKWFGVAERRGHKWTDNDLSGTYAAYVGWSSTVYQTTLNWVKREMDPMGGKAYHPSPYGVMVWARNQTQVREWLLASGIPIWNSAGRVTQPAQEGTTMYDDEGVQPTSRRERQIEAARRRIEREQDRIDRLMSLPDEPQTLGEEEGEPNVVWFEKAFSRDGRVYTYAACKAGDGLWYTTGPATPKGYTWDQLIDWINKEGTVQVWQATEYQAI